MLVFGKISSIHNFSLILGAKENYKPKPDEGEEETSNEPRPTLAQVRSEAREKLKELTEKFCLEDDFDDLDFGDEDDFEDDFGEDSEDE